MDKIADGANTKVLVFELNANNHSNAVRWQMLWR